MIILNIYQLFGAAKITKIQSYTIFLEYIQIDVNCPSLIFGCIFLHILTIIHHFYNIYFKFLCLHYYIIIK